MDYIVRRAQAAPVLPGQLRVIVAPGEPAHSLNRVVAAHQYFSRKVEPVLVGSLKDAYQVLGGSLFDFAPLEEDGAARRERTALRVLAQNRRGQTQGRRRRSGKTASEDDAPAGHGFRAPLRGRPLRTSPVGAVGDFHERPAQHGSALCTNIRRRPHHAVPALHQGEQAISLPNRDGPKDDLLLFPMRRRSGCARAGSRAAFRPDNRILHRWLRGADGGGHKLPWSHPAEVVMSRQCAPTPMPSTNTAPVKSAPNPSAFIFESMWADRACLFMGRLPCSLRGAGSPPVFPSSIRRGCSSQFRQRPGRVRGTCCGCA
jgi:hypothetical protein